MTILAVGTDARGNNYDYGLGDVIRLVRVDFVNPKVTVLNFRATCGWKFPILQITSTGRITKN